MVKLVLLASAMAVMGALGYFGERYLRPTPQVETPEGQAPFTPESKLLFELPLGNFTMQFAEEGSILHLAFNLVVFIEGETAFHRINGGIGKAKVRDTVVLSIADLAEADKDFVSDKMGEAEARLLAESIVIKLYATYPEIRTARIAKYSATRTLR